MDIVIAAQWRCSFYDTFRESVHYIERLLRDVSCYKVFDSSLAQAFQITLQVIKSHYNAFFVGIVFQKLINQPYTGVGHGHMFYLWVFPKELAQGFQCLIRRVWINEYGVNDALREVFMDIRKKSFSACSVRVGLVSCVTDKSDQCYFTNIAACGQEESSECAAFE